MPETVSLRSVHGKYLSAQPDGRAEWNREVPAVWEFFDIEERQGRKIVLRGAHGMYVSAQPDGSVQINSRAAPPGGWEEFTVEIRPNVVCLKSCHGKYLSAQQDGTAQWNRDHAPRGGWEEFQIEHTGNTGQRESAATAASMPPSLTVSGDGSSEVNGTYVFKPGEHQNRHWGTIAGHYQHTQNPEVFIAFQDCGKAHQRPQWNKWMIISKIGVLYAAHTGGKIGVPPREGVWETVDSWGSPGAPGGKHPAPTVRLAENKDARRIEHLSETSSPKKFEFIPISEYDEVWNDKGSGAEQDVSIWRARVPTGCHLIGMTAKNGHSRPTFSTLVIRAGGSDIAPPERFDLVWWQERGLRRFWCWRPIPPPGYVSLGDVGTLSETPPSRGDVVCVALGCLSPNTQPLDGQIWKDNGGGAPKDAAFFEQPGGTGLFHCSDNTHNKPYGVFHLPASRKDFQVEARLVGTQPPDVADVKSKRTNVTIAMVVGICMLIPGLPLFIGGHGPPGEEQLGMIIPGAIMMGVGGFLTIGASFVHISLWAKSYAETGKSAPRWTWIGMVFAVLLLTPGIALLIIGAISSGSIHHHEATSPARLWITDADGLGDYGFIIFIEGAPGDFDNDGIHDYCEIATVNATHSGLWMSDPWTSRAKQNDADQTRQVFELEIAHDGSGCDAEVWPEQIHGLVKLGRACYGCMAGYTDISASRNDASYPIPMWIQDGEKVVEAIGLTIAGSIMSGIGTLSLVSLSIIRKAFKANSIPAHKGKAPAIEVSEAIEGKPVRFRINEPPNSRTAWVGIYPSGAGHKDHGEEGERWMWLRDLDVNRASFPRKSTGSWSIRVFQDDGFTVVCRMDFDILPKKERWWED